jgi:predicted adenine nucleotide alpha hydrolase (AANH) superfamily ATPase
MKVLIHSCCAPCLTYPRETLEGEDHDVSALWYNPNIHPYREYQKRMHEVQRYSALVPIDVHYIDEYPLADWLEDIQSSVREGKVRCVRCYELRLARTAAFASENGFDAFTTTLLVSKHQDHGAVREAGEEAGKRHGVEFLYRDLRKGWKRSIEISKELQLYRQPYCGCVFSEHERYSGDR